MPARALPLAALLICVVASAAAWAGPRAGEAGRGLIVFWSDSPYPSLWAVRPDGTHLRRVWPSRQNAKRPALSPDRRWIAFDGAPPGKPPLSDFDIEVVDVNGKHRRTVVGSPQAEIDAQWSPDGTLLSFTRAPTTRDLAEHGEIWIVRREGTGQVRLGPGSGARWSPDGRRLVFSAPTASSDGDLFVMNADGTERRLLLGTRQAKQPAAWSRDGSQILFTGFGGRALSGDVYLMNADGTNVRRLTRTPGHDIAAGWSPDGSKILFTSVREGFSHLFVMNRDGSKPHSISRTRRNQFDPSWR